ncbi:restriction endonuclease subunit S [Streptococcus parasuis]|uniref:restriction endonuclease subunit S n=1 Tax=Streptococcus parasuis TaxID=1501662 RepID=UPI002FD8F24C
MSECGVKEFKLRELLKIYNGTKYDHLNKGDIPLYGSGGLMSHVNEALYSGEAILLPRKGTLSNIMYVNESFWTVDTMYYAVVNDKLADAFYLYSYLSQLDLSNLDSGSTLPSMTKSAYESIVVKLPDLKIQKAVATVLFNIRKKLEINNQINQELEAMAKTLYDYWFVQFDFPDENGKPYKSSGGKMVYNDQLKREIPEGWGVKQLGDIETNIVTGKTPSRSIPENFGGDIPFITIGDIRGNTFIYSSAETLSDLGAEEQNKKYLPPNSLCVSCIATVGEIGFTTQLSQTNQQINSIIFNDVNHMYFLYFALKLFFESSKTKTGNTFANMSKDDFSKILIIYPDSSVIKNYYEKVKSMFDKIKCLQLQNQELTQLRDWLLPMLMNGQVKVEDKT